MHYTWRGGRQQSDMLMLRYQDPIPNWSPPGVVRRQPLQVWPGIHPHRDLTLLYVDTLRYVELILIFHDFTLFPE